MDWNHGDISGKGLGTELGGAEYNSVYVLRHDGYRWLLSQFPRRILVEGNWQKCLCQHGVAMEENCLWLLPAVLRNIPVASSVGQTRTAAAWPVVLERVYQFVNSEASTQKSSRSDKPQKQYSTWHMTVALRWDFTLCGWGQGKGGKCQESCNISINQPSADANGLSNIDP